MKGFDGMRFAKYLRYEIGTRRADLLWVAALPAAMFTYWGLKSLILGDPAQEFGSASFVAGLLAGLITALNAYRLEHNPQTAPSAIMLPVRESERFLARCLTTAVVPFFGQMAILIALGNVFSLFTALAGNGAFIAIVPETYWFTRYLGIFVLAHSMALAGGVFFKTHPFVKTSLAVLAYASILGLAATLLAVNDILRRGGLDLLTSDIDQGSLTHGFNSASRVADLSWRFLFPLLLYVAAFFRAREIEVRS